MWPKVAVVICLIPSLTMSVAVGCLTKSRSEPTSVYRMLIARCAMQQIYSGRSLKRCCVCTHDLGADVSQFCH